MGTRVLLLVAVLAASLHYVFPQLTNGAIAGWIYFNLDEWYGYPGARQARVTVSMREEQHYSVQFDATALGNGCSPVVPESEVTRTGGAIIGPAANDNP